MEFATIRRTATQANDEQKRLPSSSLSPVLKAATHLSKQEQHEPLFEFDCG